MKRQLKNTLKKRLQEDRAVALLGPRQSGKSFLLREVLQENKGNLIDLDDPLLREEIARDPLAFLRRQYDAHSFLFIDEAAKVPSIFEALKILIDERGSDPSHICLTNSGNYLLMQRIKESLAGRVSLLSLYPLAWREFTAGNNDVGLLKILKDEIISLPSNLPASFTEIERMRNERLLWGGFPTPALSGNADVKIRWANDYLKTYVFPILIEQFNIRAIEAFEKCARLLFLQSGQTTNYHRIAQEAGISLPTVSSYAHQLKAMMLIATLETYLRNPKKRLLKHPKIHVADPILLHHALGTNFNLETARERGCLGSIYESFIVFEIIKTLETAGIPYQLYHWKTADKAETDLVLEAAGKTIPLEIKFSEKLSGKDSSGLRSFLEDSSLAKAGYIIYPGKTLQEISPSITAIPDWWFLGAY